MYCFPVTLIAIGKVGDQDVDVSVDKLVSLNVARPSS
jgi:hypothetical protein